MTLKPAIKNCKKIVKAILKKGSLKCKYLKHQFYSFIPLSINKKLVEPIFIIGSGSSGTTVLSRVLAIHRDVYSAGEADEIWFIADKATTLRDSRIKGKFHFDEADFKVNQREKLDRIFYRILKNAKKSVY